MSGGERNRVCMCVCVRVCACVHGLYMCVWCGVCVYGMLYVCMVCVCACVCGVYVCMNGVCVSGEGTR